VPPCWFFGLVSLSQYSLVCVGGWACLRVHFAFDLPFELSILEGGVVASSVGVVCGPRNDNLKVGLARPLVDDRRAKECERANRWPIDLLS
jgi:hypothetical protein